MIFLHVPFFFSPVQLHFDKNVLLSNIRTVASTYLGCRALDVELYIFIPTHLLKLDLALDNLPLQVFFCVSHSFFATKHMTAALEEKYTRIWEQVQDRKTEAYNIYIHYEGTDVPLRIQIRMHDRVFDLRQRIFDLGLLSVAAPTNIQMQSMVPSSPLIEDDHQRISNLVPPDDHIYIVSSRSRINPVLYGDFEPNSNCNIPHPDPNNNDARSNITNDVVEDQPETDKENPTTQRKLQPLLGAEENTEVLSQQNKPQGIEANNHSKGSNEEDELEVSCGSTSTGSMFKQNKGAREGQRDGSCATVQPQMKAKQYKRWKGTTELNISSGSESSDTANEKLRTLFRISNPTRRQPNHNNRADFEVCSDSAGSNTSSEQQCSGEKRTKQHSCGIMSMKRLRKMTSTTKSARVTLHTHFDFSSDSDEHSDLSDRETVNSTAGSRGQCLESVPKVPVAPRRSARHAKVTENLQPFIEDETLLFDMCCNCHRCEDGIETDRLPYAPKLLHMNLADLSLRNRRKFIYIERTDYMQDQFGNQQVPICSLCYEYLRCPASELPVEAAVVWPAFIWSTLRHSDTFHSSWSLLPQEWKVWWLRSVAVKHQVDKQILLSKDSKFQELTIKAEKDLAALSNLRWAEDILPRELSFVLAEVKCPAGCGEFKHKANNIPLDIVWEFCLGKETTLYTSRKKTLCHRWFRGDYLMSEQILWNKSWVCKPSIAYCRATLAPVVLSCRYHTSKYTKQMIHPCRNPSGTIATEKSSQFTPVTPIPRTLRKAQYSAYSASFRIAKMEGCYYGLDTMYLSANGGYHYHQSNLAWQQEKLAFQNRKDLRSHLARLVQEKKVMPNLATALLDAPNDNQNSGDWLLGSNYMTLDDSVRLQQNIFYSRKEATRVIKQDSVHSQLIWFNGVWPRHLLHIHPGGCSYGAVPFHCPTFKSSMGGKKDARSAWLLSSMLLCVPELWEATTSAYKAVKSWEGWLLTFLTSTCLRHLNLNGQQSPFKVLKQADLYKKHIQLQHTSGFAPEVLAAKFKSQGSQIKKYTNISVQKDKFMPPTEDIYSICIVINHRKDSRRGNMPVFFKKTYSGWKLRFLALSEKSANINEPQKWYGSIYSKHGGSQHTDWWKQSSSMACPAKTQPSWTPAVLGSNITRWNVCVFVRNTPLIGQCLRNQVLEACGGQYKLKCQDHQLCLILTPKVIKYVCCYSQDQSIGICTKLCKYICPNEDCRLGICATHAKHISAQVASNSNISLQNAILPSEYAGVVRQRMSVHNASIIQDDDTDEEILPARDNTNHTTLDHSLQADPGSLVLGNTQGLDDFAHADKLFEEQYDFNMTDTDIPITLPSTNAAQDPIYASISASDVENSKMTSHALLNCYGSCLVRRNRKLAGTLAQRSFLQKLVATNVGSSVPLVYPEGMLFSDIFFADTQCGAVIGALPAALLHGDRILKQNGMATLQDTYRTRLMSSGLLTSANPKYHFWAFDALANFSLRGTDSRLILRRGFAEAQDQGGVRLRGKQEPIFDSDHVECRTLVNKICASCGESTPTFFYTHTCSMKTHFGIRILWDWLTSQDLVDSHCKEVTESEIEHWKKSLIESCGAYLLRVWMELVQIWLLYIHKSPEEPLGQVTQYVARLELQQTLNELHESISKGNLPHMHCLFWTADDLTTSSGLFNACDRIRGYVDDIIRPHEATQYLETKIFESSQDMQDFKDTMRRFLNHTHHRRCFVIRKDETTGTFCLKKTCKVPNNWLLTEASGDHFFKEFEVEHTQEAIRIMIDLGVAEKSGDMLLSGQPLKFIPKFEYLQGDKHIPPCRGSDGIMSPVIGVLVAINPNSDNCQLANGYFVARYLAKYIIKIDEYCTFKISPPSTSPNTNSATMASNDFPVSGTELHNTKITSNRIAQQGDLDRGHKPKMKNALGINVCDVYMRIFDYPTVYTNLRHVRYHTETFDNRAGRSRKKPIDILTAQSANLQANALTSIDTIPAHHAREISPNTPHWRKFTDGQIRKAVDELYSPLSVDSITIFGQRPPELHFVRHLRYYSKWFTRTNPTYTHTSRSGRASQRKITSLPGKIEFCIANYDPHLPLERTLWISTSTEIVKLRVAALPPILQYLNDVPLSVFGDAPSEASTIKCHLRKFFRLLQKAVLWVYKGTIPDSIPLTSENQVRLKGIVERFTCEPNETILPTPWATPIRPLQGIRFLIHLLLSYGSFIDEYTLFQPGNLRQSFIDALLLDPANVQHSARKLLLKYFYFELRILPAGTPTFDRYCTLAFHIIQTFFSSGTFYTDEIPTVLYCRLRENTTAGIESFAARRKTNLLKTMLKKLSDMGFVHLPSFQALFFASFEAPLNWDIANIQQPPSQPTSSYEEQKVLLQIAKQRIDAYASMNQQCLQSLCFVGAGGVGKTTCAMIALLYARSQGLTINATALVSERAQEFGVPHYNSDFAVPRVDLNHISPGQLAERTIANLYRKPEQLEFHRTVDVEFIDEMGPISAELWTSRDIVLRYIRHSTKPNGGKLDLVTFDHLQTHPVQGTHPLLNPFLVSSYTFHMLSESVRACESQQWMRIQAITRMSYTELREPSVEDEFVHLLTTSCTFVPSATLVPSDVLFVYGKNAPIRLHQQQLAQQLQSRQDVITSFSVDFESGPEGRFVPAQPSTVRFLDKKLREASKLYLFKGARYRITFNKVGCFSNGQIAFLHELPSRSDVKKKKPIPFLLSPPGCSYLPSSTDSADSLCAAGWTLITIGIAPDNIVHGKIRAKRTAQYGVQLFISSTWHSTMGKTLARLATQVGLTGLKTDPYSIWDPTQVVIMLSRTKLPKHTIFISDNPEETARAIFRVLLSQSPFRVYLSKLLASLCNRSTETEHTFVDQGQSIFRPRDVMLPPDNTGFVYILISTRDLKHLYIGSCYNLILRYERHNSGFGAIQTSPISLRPWALLAYVSGFQGNKHHFLSFEQQWIAAKQHLSFHSPSTISVEAIVGLGLSLKDKFNNLHNTSLSFVHCGTLTSIPTNMNVILSSSSEQSDSDIQDSDFASILSQTQGTETSPVFSSSSSSSSSSTSSTFHSSSSCSSSSSSSSSSAEDDNSQHSTSRTQFSGHDLSSHANSSNSSFSSTTSYSTSSNTTHSA